MRKLLGILLVAWAGCGAPQRSGGAPCNRLASCRAACRAGTSEACFRLATLLDRWPDRAAIDRDLPLLERDCDAGHVRTCVGLSDLVCEPGRAATPPAGCDTREHELLTRACDAGDALGCYGLTHAADSSARDDLVDRTLTLLRDGCDRRGLFECALLAMLTGKGGSGAAVVTRARALLEVACDRDDALGCSLLALLSPRERQPALRAKLCRLAPEAYACDSQKQ